MSSTNDAFIKAYRTDAAQAAPKSSYRQQPVMANWQTTVEIVSPEYAASLDAIEQPATVEPRARASNRERRTTIDRIAKVRAEQPTSPMPATRGPHRTPSAGKRPLSSFLAEPAVEIEAPAETPFTPETRISAFRWPSVVRTLWEQYGDEFDHVAEVLLDETRVQPTIIGVAGIHAGDGCTTNVLCLAMALAARGARPVLVDGNFAAPRLAHRLGIEPAATWQDAVTRGVSIAEVVVRAMHDNVDLLPLDSHLSPSEPQLADRELATTANMLRSAYRIALVDLGPLLNSDSFATADDLLRNMPIDAAVLVTDIHRADSGELDAAGVLLRETGCRLLGAIENRAVDPHTEQS